MHRPCQAPDGSVVRDAALAFSAREAEARSGAIGGATAVSAGLSASRFRQRRARTASNWREGSARLQAAVDDSLVVRGREALRDLQRETERLALGDGSGFQARI